MRKCVSLVTKMRKPEMCVCVFVSLCLFKPGNKSPYLTMTCFIVLFNLCNSIVITLGLTKLYCHTEYERTLEVGLCVDGRTDSEMEVLNQ